MLHSVKCKYATDNRLQLNHGLNQCSSSDSWGEKGEQKYQQPYQQHSKIISRPKKKKGKKKNKDGLCSGSLRQAGRQRQIFHSERENERERSLLVWSFFIFKTRARPLLSKVGVKLVSWMGL